jgi:Domain of unknown function (DUF4168)
MRSTARFYAAMATVGLPAASLLFAPAANAQDQSPSAPPMTAPGPTTMPATIPDNKLDATAAAVKSVSAVKHAYQQKLDQAPAAEKERVADEANDAMTKAVTDQGLSIEEYTSIMRVAQADPTVREKLLQRLK